MNFVPKKGRQGGWRSFWALLSILTLLWTVASAGLAQAAPQGPMGAAPWSPPTPAWRVYVGPDNQLNDPELSYAEADGLYQLDYDYLAAAGMLVNEVDPSTFRMFYMNQEIPIRVEDDGDAIFESGEVVLFYGRGVDSLFLDGLAPSRIYTANSVFWLTYGGQPGLRMAERDGSGVGTASAAYPRREHIERQYLYLSAYPYQSNADHWYAHQFSAPKDGTGSQSYTFTVADLPAGSFSARLRTRTLGYGLRPHHLRLYVNETLVMEDSTSWYGYDLFETSTDFDQSLLAEGSNSIRLELVDLPGAPDLGDAAYVDWVDVTYNDSYTAESNQLPFSVEAAGSWEFTVNGFTENDIEAFDVTSLTGVSRITGATIDGTNPYSIRFGDSPTGPARYLALTKSQRKTPLRIEKVTYPSSRYTPPNLAAPAFGADYILISHPDFWEQARTLADHRYRTFDRVALVSVQQIYDQFNGGHMSAEAIHDFLEYAYSNWESPAPEYVLLLGDGNYDMRDYKGSSGSTFIPPYLELVDPDLGETAADNRFVTLTGADTLPEMHIGRFVANTPSQAAAMVDKTINYETSCHCNTPNDWNYNILFVADDLEGGGGNFYDYSDEVADGFADPPANTIPLLPDNYTKEKAYLGQTCDITGNPSPATGCRTQILNELNTEGALLVSYVGHSTKFAWADERLFDSSMVNSLTNGPCLPIMLPMTCFEGSFHEIGYATSTLAETAVRTPVKGAVASWSPTGFGLVSGHDYLEKGIFLALFHHEAPTLGAAITEAKQYLWDNEPLQQYRDLLDTFVLLGDPALEVKTEYVCSLIPTAVKIEGFRAQRSGESVLISWTTAVETDILGFNILRGSEGEEELQGVNAEPILAASPGSDRGAEYSFLDIPPTDGQYRYVLEILKLDGSAERFGDVVTAAAGPPHPVPVWGRQ